jgi:hypothetical protein
MRRMPTAVYSYCPDERNHPARASSIYLVIFPLPAVCGMVWNNAGRNAMTRAPCLVLIFSMMMGIVAPAYAQQTPETAKQPTPDTAKSPEPAKSSPTTPDTATSAATAPAAAADAAPATKFEIHFIPAATPDVPSADTLKKARDAGYHTKVRRGEVYYCKDVVETGTHFKTETCVDENQLAQTLVREQAQRDQFSNHTCSGGGCSGK